MEEKKSLEYIKLLNSRLIRIMELSDFIIKDPFRSSSEKDIAKIIKKAAQGN